MPTDDEILRIAAQFDVGTITAGMDEAAASVKAGTAKMEDSFSNLAAAQIRVSSAQKELRETLNATVSGGLSPTVSATEEVAAAMYEAKVATDALKAAQEQAFGSTQRFAGGVTNGRVALTGLTQDLGLHGSRVLASFLAQSETIGPILSKAFAGIAVVAFIELLDQGNKKLAEMTDSIAGFGKAAQATYQQMLDANQRAIVGSIDLNAQIRAIDTIGLKGNDKFTADEKNRAQEIQDTAAALKAANIERAKQFDIMQHLRNAADFWHDPLYGLTDATRNLAEGEASLKRYERTVEELEAKLKSLMFVQQPTGRANQHAFQVEEAEKYSETLARIYDEESALTQRNAEKELRDLQRIADAKERLDEEMEKATLDLAKKDLEDFNRNALEKLRTQEETGRAQIDSVHSVYNAETAALKIQRQEHDLTLAAYTSAVMRAAQQEYEAEYAVLQREVAAVQQAGNLRVITEEETSRRVATLFAQEARLFEDLQRKKIAIQQQADREQQQSIDRLAQQWSQDVMRLVNSTLSGKEKIGAAFAQMAKQMELQLIDQGIGKVVTKWGEEMLSLIANHSAMLARLLGIQVAGNVQQAAASKAEASQEVTASAAIAGAAAFASAMEALPFPMNTAAAPAAMAAAVSTAMSNLGLLAFEKGGIMPNSESLALLHPREMILPSSISESVQRMAASGQSGRAGGNIRVNNTQHIYGSPSANDLAKMEQATTNAVRRASRRGGWGN